jgi:hypothetical protein
MRWLSFFVQAPQRRSRLRTIDREQMNVNRDSVRVSEVHTYACSRLLAYAALKLARRAREPNEEWRNWGPRRHRMLKPLRIV